MSSNLNLCTCHYKLNINENECKYCVIDEPNFKYYVKFLDTNVLDDHDNIELLFEEYLEYNGKYYDKYNHFNLKDNSEPILYKFTARRLNSAIIDVIQTLNKEHVKLYGRNTYIHLNNSHDYYEESFKCSIISDAYKNLADFISYESIFNELNLKERLNDIIWFTAKVSIDKTID